MFSLWNVHVTSWVWYVLVTESRACTAEEFTCRGTPGECVPLTWMCDDSFDCSDGSDEKACSKNASSSFLF